MSTRDAANKRPCGGADERNGIEGKAARQRGHAEQPQHEHEFLPVAPGHLVLRRDGALVSGVGVRPIPRKDRQQSPFHADDHLRQESDEAEDTVRHRDAQRVRRWLGECEPDAKHGRRRRARRTMRPRAGPPGLACAAWADADADGAASRRPARRTRPAPPTMVSAKIHANGPRHNSVTNRPVTPV